MTCAACPDAALSGGQGLGQGLRHAQLQYNVHYMHQVHAVQTRPVIYCGGVNQVLSCRCCPLETLRVSGHLLSGTLGESGHLPLEFCGLSHVTTR